MVIKQVFLAENKGNIKVQSQNNNHIPNWRLVMIYEKRMCSWNIIRRLHNSQVMIDDWHIILSYNATSICNPGPIRPLLQTKLTYRHARKIEENCPRAQYLKHPSILVRQKPHNHHPSRLLQKPYLGRWDVCFHPITDNFMPKGKHKFLYETVSPWDIPHIWVK